VQLIIKFPEVKEELGLRFTACKKTESLKEVWLQIGIFILLKSRGRRRRRHIREQAFALETCLPAVTYL
jgi:hypothetical protein